MNYTPWISLDGLLVDLGGPRTGLDEEVVEASLLRLAGYEAARNKQGQRKMRKRGRGPWQSMVRPLIYIQDALWLVQVTAPWASWMLEHYPDFCAAVITDKPEERPPVVQGQDECHALMCALALYVRRGY